LELMVAAALVAGAWTSSTLAAAAETGRQAQTAKTVPTGRSPGKPRPPVEARLLQAQGLESGVPGSLVLQLRGRPGIEILDLQVEGDDGLSVVSVTPSRGTALSGLSAALQASGEVTQWQIAATPTLGGNRNLSGLVTFSVNGVRQAAPFNVAVQVGGSEGAPVAPRQKPTGSLVTTPSGELIDSMPAETTVR
jgi:hypothetical protein